MEQAESEIMTQSQLIKRIENLERELVSVKQRIARNGAAKPRRSAEDFYGMFHNDPDFKKAMELGAAYRRSLRPGNSKKRIPKK